MKQSSAMSDERPADDAALIEKLSTIADNYDELVRAIVGIAARAGVDVQAITGAPASARHGAEETPTIRKAAARLTALNAERSERIEEVERLRKALATYDCGSKCSYLKGKFLMPDGRCPREHEGGCGKVARAALFPPSRGGHDAG